MSGLETPPTTQPMQDAGVTPTILTGPVHHEKYYDAGVPDAIFIQVEDYLYRQSRHYLREHITFLKELDCLPPPSDGHEGLTEANPLHLPGVKNATFEQLLSIIYLRIYSDESQSKMTQDEILDVLTFCDKWDVPSAKGYCLDYLDQAIRRRELHPMLALSIGRKFNRSRWLRDALNKLQDLPIRTWVDNPLILSWMSPQDMLIVFRLREHAHALRLEFVCFRPPAIHTQGCKNAEECSFLWELSWAMTVVPRIAHSSYSPGELFMFVKELWVDGMGTGCCEESREEALKSDRFYGHLRGVDKALRLIH